MNDRDRLAPSQDPSSLTTSQLHREITMLRELLVREDTNNRAVLETRLDAMDKAIELLQFYPTEVDRTVANLKELHQEKFNGVGESLIAAKEASAAWQKCSEESITKSEVSIAKQIDNMGGLLHTRTHALDEKIDDIKTRLTSIESHAKGSGAMWGYVVGAVGLLATLGGLIALVFRYK